MTRQRCVYITSPNFNSKKSPWRLKRENRTSLSEWKKSLKSINTNKTERATWRHNIRLISIVIKVTAQLLPTLLPQAHTTYTPLFSTSLGFSLNPSLNLSQGNLPQPISLLIFLLSCSHHDKSNYYCTAAAKSELQFQTHFSVLYLKQYGAE